MSTPIVSTPLPEAQTLALEETVRPQTPSSREVFVRRRMFCIFLPFVVLGMSIYMYSFTLTTTINGGSVLGFTVTGIAVLAAARDSRNI